MARRRRKKKNTHSDVELNMAAMLDMAFQLLAFFILTFRPSPVESQISLRMPDKPVQGTGGQVTEQKEQEDFGLQLTVTALSTPDGDLAGVEVGDRVVGANASAAQLIANLNATLGDYFKDSSFDGITLQVSGDLNYERLMQVLDVCSHQKLPNGEPMTNVSINTIKGR